MDMCRFSHANDPNYRKVGGELRSIYRSLTAEAALGHRKGLAPQTNDRELSDEERGTDLLAKFDVYKRDVDY